MRQRGASLVEYVLLIALIAGVALGALTFLGRSATSKFSQIANANVNGGGTVTTVAPPPTTTTTVCVPNGNGHGNNCH